MPTIDAVDAIDAVDRDRLATDHLPLAYRAVKRLQSSPRWGPAYRDPDDARSDAFYALAIAVRSFDPDRGATFAGHYVRALRWVAGMALGRHHAAKRSTARTVPLYAGAPEMVARPDGPDPADAELGRVLMARLAGLPDSQSTVIRRHLIDGESFAEIARDRGLSKQAVHQQYTRGLASLRGQSPRP